MSIHRDDFVLEGETDIPIAFDAVVVEPWPSVGSE